MARSIGRKARYAAWVDEKLAKAVDAWVDTRPGKNRTDFLIEAAIETLLRERIIHRRDLLGGKPERRSGKSTKRGQKVLFTTWVNATISAGIDKWLQRHPEANRTEFAIHSASEKLSRDFAGAMEKLRNKGKSMTIDKRRLLRDLEYLLNKKTQCEAFLLELNEMLEKTHLVQQLLENRPRVRSR
jgi:hypothetical protein